MPIDPRFPYVPPDPTADLSQGFGEQHTGWGDVGKGAMAGLQYGKYLGAGALPAAGIGALVGWAKSRTNSTKNAREDFAKQLGVGDTTALWQKLNTSLDPTVAGELQNRALNRIGKHDATANQQWMSDVLAALSAPQAMASAPTAQPAPAAAPVDPRRQALIAALKGGGDLQPALTTYLGSQR
jgi:hypothetical protein